MKKCVIIFILIISVFSYSGQIIYVSVELGLQLYKVNIGNCTSTLIASYPNGPMLATDIAVTPNGQLWGTDGGQIFKIDTVNGNRSNPFTIGVYSGSNSMADLNDSTLLVTGDGNLYQISTTTGSLTLMSNNIQFNGDLTWYDQHLYGSTGYTLMKLKLSNDNMSIVSRTTISSEDEYKAFQNYGLGTAAFQNDINYIIGSAWYNLIKLCPLNCYYMPVCPNLFSQDKTISGIASRRLAPQVPEPTMCQGNFVGISSLANNTEQGVTISPNPGNEATRILFSRKHQTINIVLCDALGKPVLNLTAFDVKTLDIPLSNINNGVYLTQITVDSNTYYQKLIVSHE